MTEKKGCFSHSPQDVQQDKSVKKWGQRLHGNQRKVMDGIYFVTQHHLN